MAIHGKETTSAPSASSGPRSSSLSSRALVSNTKTPANEGSPSRSELAPFMDEFDEPSYLVMICLRVQSVSRVEDMTGSAVRGLKDGVGLASHDSCGT